MEDIAGSEIWQQFMVWRTVDVSNTRKLGRFGKLEMRKGVMHYSNDVFWRWSQKDPRVYVGPLFIL